MDVISQTTFSNAFSWMKIFVFRFKFHSNLFLRVQLTISQHGSDNGSAPSRRQAITLTNAGPVHLRIYAIPEEDELTSFIWYMYGMVE